MGRRLAVAAAIIGLSAQLVGPSAVSAWQGDPDGSFGNCGRATFHAGRSFSWASSVAAQTDGKIVIGGGRGTADGSPIVARFTASGAIDTTFVGGFVDVANEISDVHIALQGNRILAATKDLIVRYTPKGAPDTAFGVNGTVSSTAAGLGLLVQNDATIVSIAEPNVAARFTATGSPDATFGSGGQVALPFTPAAIAHQPDGKLVIGGEVPHQGGGSDFAITRLNIDGTPDTSFGLNGLVVDDLRNYDRVNGLAVVSDKIVASGPVNTKVGLTRYLPNGQRDESFGNAGSKFYRLGAQAIPVGLTAMQNGKLVVAGTADFGNDFDVFVIRLTDNGRLDASFAFGGISLKDDGPFLRVNASTVQSDGRVIAVGHFPDADRTAMSLWRFQPDGSTASYPDLGYVLDGYGGLHSVASGCAGAAPQPVGAPAWPGWDIARDVVALYGGKGYVLDGYGGLHSFNFYAAGAVTPPPSTYGGPYWRGWDIARAAAVLPDESGGYVLDGYGGLHPFGIYGPLPPSTTGGAYWAGWDIARGAVILPNGQGGYVLDGFGGIHRFAIDGGPLPPAAVGGPAWPGWDIARSITLLPDASGGYVLDGYGGLHPFSIGSAPRPPSATGGPAWPGWDIARGVSLFR